MAKQFAKLLMYTWIPPIIVIYLSFIFINIRLSGSSVELLIVLLVLLMFTIGIPFFYIYTMYTFGLKRKVSFLGCVFVCLAMNTFTFVILLFTWNIQPSTDPAPAQISVIMMFGSTLILLAGAIRLYLKKRNQNFITQVVDSKIR